MSPVQAKSEQSVDILIVDDREDGLIALEALFAENKNYNLVKARSGAEAVLTLPHHDFAVILLDVQMPEWDGFKTAEVIRQHPQFQKIPIIFVTAINKDERYVYKGYELGAVDYIFKPFDPVILKSKVSVFAELHRKENQIREQEHLLREKEMLEHHSAVQTLELKNLKRYSNLADSIPHIVWKASEPGSIDYFNQLWCDYTGQSGEDSLGTQWQAAFNPNDLKLLLSSWRDAAFDGNNFEVECRIRRYDGEYRWHWVRTVIEGDAEGKFIGWLATCTDIQDRKTTEIKLIDAQKLAESANEAKTQFLANMSHEIRTPLNAITGFSELMVDEHITPAERRKNYFIVKRNAQHLLKIIDEILDISKIEAGGLEIDKSEVSIESLVYELKSFASIQLAKKNNKLDFIIHDKIPDHIITDGTRLKQILQNAIGNAIKFTQNGLVQVVTSFKVKSDGVSYMRWSVSDTGIGISEHNKDKIFTPFFQADSSSTRIHGGTGLGLALSRNLAKSLGGNLWLEKSRLGYGTTFILEIKTQTPAMASWISKFSDMKLDSEIVTPEIKDQSLLGTRILLVEDAEDNQTLITHYLKKSGAILDIASDGQEGIEKALSSDYEVILMDIQMPRVDGLEATSRLRKIGYNKPIIALTAHALENEREKCLKIGCTAHLTKPINKQQLIQSLIKYAPAYN